VSLSQRIDVRLGRFAIFLVYFWFGFLKLIGLSPAGPLVLALFEKTLGFMMPFPIFYSLFAVFEMAIGILFLIKGFEKLAFLFLAIHIFTTVLPLILLPSIAWNAPFVPTLEGQYILKNILIVSVAVFIAARKKD